MKIDVKEFRVPPGHKLKLKRWPTRITPFCNSKEECARKLEQHAALMSEMQGRLYADGRQAALIIFQAMDAAGKDGAIKHVMSGVNPQGCQVFSFKAPGAEDLAHDFLWRTTRCLPARGNIGIFNRSYYEEVLVVKVHPEFLEKQRLPEPLLRDPGIWKHRYHSINEYEKHLARNGTKVVKIFLHLSKEEQRRRLLSRIEEPDKNWKISLDDIRERQRWKDYTKVYQECLEATSADYAPWYCVPADDKPNARLIISQIIIDALKDLKIQPPHAAPGMSRELPKMRRALAVKS
jgi:PPK2 family polyphosphate:nucleotide phosphotransferase